MALREGPVRIARWRSPASDAPRQIDTPPLPPAVDGDLVIASALCRDALDVFVASLPYGDDEWLERFADHLRSVGETLLGEVRRVVGDSGPSAGLDRMRHAALLTRELHHAVRALPEGEMSFTSMRRAVVEASQALQAAEGALRRRG